MYLIFIDICGPSRLVSQVEFRWRPNGRQLQMPLLKI